MYALVRRDRVADPTRRDEVAQRLSEGLVPVLRQTEGFVACYVVADDGGDVVCVAVFADRAGVDASAREAAAWIARSVAELLLDRPDIKCGLVWET